MSSDTLARLESRIATAHARAIGSGAWAFLGPGHSYHHIVANARRTTCGRSLADAIVNSHTTDPGQNPCRACWHKVVGTKAPQDRKDEESMAASTKTKPKKDTKSKVTELADAGDTAVQNADKMQKIRAQRRVVKKCEIEVGNATESRKLAKEELEAARAELYRLIDDSPQGELFVAHVSRETGELETEDDD